MTKAQEMSSDLSALKSSRVHVVNICDGALVIWHKACITHMREVMALHLLANEPDKNYLNGE
jgi:hypothetical protein